MCLRSFFGLLWLKQKVDMENLELISKKFSKIKDVLNERSLRICRTTEVEAIGLGGIYATSQ